MPQARISIPGSSIEEAVPWYLFHITNTLTIDHNNRISTVFDMIDSVTEMLLGVPKYVTKFGRL